MAKKWAPSLKHLPADSHERPLYLSVVDALAADITGGRLHAGDALPPHRELAQRLGVSPGTAAKAYAEARRRGLVEGSRRLGTRVRSGDGLARLLSVPRTINFASTKPNPSISPDLTAALATVRRQQAELMSYPPPEGSPRHRHAGQRWLQMLDIETASLCVLPTAGAQHGLSMAMVALLEPGDTIAAASLCYPGLVAAARSRRMQVAGVPQDEFGLDPEALDALSRRQTVRAVYCTPSAANPVGQTMPRRRKEALVRVAAKHSLVVIEDETYRAYVDRPSQSIVELLPECTVLLTSVSKVLLGGVRVGMAAMGDGIGRRLRANLQADVLATSALDLAIVTALIEQGEVARVLERRRTEMRRRKKMARQIFRTGASSQQHGDGPFLWIELPPTLPSEFVAARAEARGVTLAPASAFASNGPYRDGVRVALSAPATDAEVEQGLSLLRDLLEDLNDGRSVPTLVI